MVDFVGLTATAQRLISENGRSVTLLQFDSDPADADQPWDGAADIRTDPDDTLTLDAVFVSPSGAPSLGFIAVTSDLIKLAEQIIIISPGASRDVTGFQEVDDGGTNWKITAVEVLRPAADVVLAYMGLKR